MLRYLETYYKSRYLVSEIAIATARRQVGDLHWQFCVDKLSERNQRYVDVAPNVSWLLTPTKVTAHRDLLIDYIPPQKFTSWAIDFLNIAESKSTVPNLYFNPAIISRQDDFFLCDSHWTSLGAKKYVEPVLSAIGVDLEKLHLHFDKAIHQGNCSFGSGDKQSQEESVYYESQDYKTVFQTGNRPVPDFSVKHGVNPNGTFGRGLIVHSSSYAYMRGLFRAMFSSITEVFSPYVPAHVIGKGKFDYVVVLFAERNCAVVYDGGIFGERILNSLNVPYIRDIANELIGFRHNCESTKDDENFMHALGQAWMGVIDEV